MKRNGFALAAAIIGTLVFGFSAVYYYASVAGMGGIIENSLSIFVYVMAAAISLNWAGWAKIADVPMLICSILYCICTLLFIPYFILMVLPIIFGFIGYAQMKRTAQNDQT